MAMTPPRYTTTQSILATVSDVAGFLAAALLVFQVGAHWPLFLASTVVGFACLYGLSQTWQAPFIYRAVLRFFAVFSLFTMVFTGFRAGRP